MPSEKFQGILREYQYLFGEAGSFEIYPGI
jgi:hypothetical protein